MIISQNIIPIKSVYYDVTTQNIIANPHNHNYELDYKAICEFIACGFFIDDATFYRNIKTLKPATQYTITNERIVAQKTTFKWHYAPLERPFAEIVNEFAQLFETIIREQVQDKKVILPLSGGLDSRTQAVALHHLNKEVAAYSYSFQNGLNETKYGKKIAKICNFPFQEFTIPKGYLWNTIDVLANANNCYADFTSPRQMAVINQVTALGEVFSLGHWGDVLFDSMGVQDDMPLQQQVEVVFHKITKKSGLQLAQSLWEECNFSGNIVQHIKDKILSLLLDIDINNNANARIRAFKSLHWAPRWTSTNLAVFHLANPITLPYYDDRMCQFICSIPEKYLASRQIQIAYIKMRNPLVAQVEWQDHRPFNLYNYHKDKFPYYVPYKVYNKLNRLISTQKYVQRNWELQFLGKENFNTLSEYISRKELNKIVPKEIVSTYFNKFAQDNVHYAHTANMLLVLSVFTNKFLAIQE